VIKPISRQQMDEEYHMVLHDDVIYELYVNIVDQLNNHLKEVMKNVEMEKANDVPRCNSCPHYDGKLL
jgi:hypothetical protein